MEYVKISLERWQELQKDLEGLGNAYLDLDKELKMIKSQKEEVVIVQSPTMTGKILILSGAVIVTQLPWWIYIYG